MRIMKWCGRFSGQPTWAHGTFSPCQSETISAALLLALAAIVIGTQYRTMRLLSRRGYLGKQTWTAASTVSACSIALLAATHAVSLVFSAVSLARKANGAPYNIFYEAAQFLIWTAALVRPSWSGHVCSPFPGALCCVPGSCAAPELICACLSMQGMLGLAHQQGVMLHFKLLMWPALVLAAWELYTCLLMAVNGWGFGGGLSVMLLVTASIQAAALLAATISESLKCAWLLDCHAPCS